MRMILGLLVFWSLVLPAAESPAGFTKQGVRVAVSIQGSGDQARVVAVFTPEAKHHVYGLELPADTPGVPTRIELAPGDTATVRGPLTADKATHELNGLAVFPEGVVTLTLPITAPAAGTVPVLVSYLACTADSCRIPVLRQRVEVQASGATSATGAKGGVFSPATRAEAEALIAAAPGPVLVDFTGPSCVNCQLMAKTVFRERAVIQALDALTLILVNTDPPHDDLAQWQQERFRSQNRPLYIRLDKGEETRWTAVFSPSETDRLQEFIAFLGGGPGRDAGTGEGLGQFIVLALLGGLVTLLMPCTYPMIPFTVTFFSKQAAAGHRLLPLALAYGAGIMGCFVGLGVLITGVFGANLATLAGHPVTNLLIGLLFVVLGLGLIGAFFLRLPAGLAGLAGGGRGGYFGALVMGLTFAITAFTCTAPFAGSVLAAAVATGTWGAAVAGMAIYSGAIAVPFVFLALSPGLLKKLPRAGAWMNEFKIIGGLVELAAAAKFLAICDLAWGWGVIGRTSVLALWAATALILAGYIAGRWRMAGDDVVEALGPGRLLGSLVFLTLGLWLIAGLAGANLGLVEAFFPGDLAPGR